MTTPVAAEQPAGTARTPVTVVVGNPKPESRTLAVAVKAAGALRAGLAGAGVGLGAPVLIDLSGRVAELVAAEDRTGVRDLLDLVRRPGGLLVVASPTFKAAYTGLLKLFIDLLPRAALRGVVAVPVMTAASALHSGVVDSHLRPLLAESGARVPVPGLCVLEADFDDLDRVLGGWLADAVPGLVSALRTAAPAAAPRAGEPLTVPGPAAGAPFSGVGGGR